MNDYPTAGTREIKPTDPAGYLAHQLETIKWFIGVGNWYAATMVARESMGFCSCVIAIGEADQREWAWASLERLQIIEAEATAKMGRTYLQPGKDYP